MADVTEPPLPDRTSRELRLDGRYRLHEEIGRGSASVVYLASDDRLGRDVAIKVLTRRADDVARARFAREATALATIGHPSIVHVYDVGVTAEGAPYVAMERLRGPTLARQLEEGPLPVPLAVALAIELYDALEAAHVAGVVHRDVKPANIVLETVPTGQIRLRLLDFGLLGLLELDAERLTARGIAVGSPAYVAPERLRDPSAPPDVRSDVYAAALVLYEMLAGRLAFEAPSPIALRGAILTKMPPPLAAIRPGVPPAIDGVVRRGLAKAPDERWQSARAAGDALRAARSLLEADEVPPASLASQPSNTTLPPGTTVGHYQLLRPIARGSLCDVYEAADLRLPRRVAVKVARGIDEAGLARLEREARAAASLCHPNVVNVLDVGVDPRHGMYVVMEHLVGEDLATRLRRTGPLSIAETMDVVLQVLDGLAAAHAQGMFHRDQRPSKVLLVPLASGGSVVKILDFGVVKLDDGGPAGLTTHGAMLGSPAYMAPEQLRGDAVDARADVFAVGIMLHELLTGEPPARRGADGGDVDLSRAPRELAPVLGRATGPLADRYRDAGAMRDALRPVRGDGSATAGSAVGSMSPPADAPRPRRARIVAASLIVAALAAVGLVAFGTTRVRPADGVNTPMSASTADRAASENPSLAELPDGSAATSPPVAGLPAEASAPVPGPTAGVDAIAPSHEAHEAAGTANAVAAPERITARRARAASLRRGEPELPIEEGSEPLPGIMNPFE